MIFEWLIITPRDQRVVNYPVWIYAPAFGGFIIVVQWMPSGPAALECSSLVAIHRYSQILSLVAAQR
jgi:hypothetical protein